MHHRLAILATLAVLISPVAASAHDMAHMAMPGDSVPVPAGTLPGGGFNLIDQNGRPRSDKDFAGRYQLIYFGFTNCPDECPVDLKKMMVALDGLPKDNAARIAPIFITVDPERDTPQVLKGYVTMFSPNLTGLTGKPADVTKVERGYKVYAAKARSDSATDYTMAHSSQMYLMGPDGKFIDVLDPHDKAAQLTAQLARDLR